jgi:hypothetical protein
MEKIQAKILRGLGFFVVAVIVVADDIRPRGKRHRFGLRGGLACPV